ncbi:cytochrome c biogenesis protein [Salana multivorans]|uniref:Cytochrome c biogenesis protein n=1 Tax=Salana multivorans TaxID=120377 RepID=A0A3N2D8R1_9MICO|nr:cytochrome c biogenesis protein ResB [Salana multivorans]ROR96092.1 cytochrome c biogenesis protein [Salana multivorans]
MARRGGYRPEGLVVIGEADTEAAAAPGEGAAPDGGAAPGAGDGAGDGAGATVARGTGWGWREWGRWGWRQLTSMRVALLLLMLLAIAAVPGAVLPQRLQDAAGVAQYFTDHPSLAPWLDRFSLFDVYTSPWFAAIYLLLFISLVGCIVPRAFEHARVLRQPPPRAPRRFTRFPAHTAFASGLPLDDAVAQARRGLRGYRLREESVGSGDARVVSISGERGYLREVGNIVFHLALVGLLVSMAYGSLVHYRGQVIIVEGETFANSRLAYDSFDTGAWFDEDSLGDFRLRLDSFHAVFLPNGQADDFRADVAVIDADGAERPASIKVNEPLRVGGASVYLMGNGYAPKIQVHDAAGKLAFSATVPFIPTSNTSYVSHGVVKVADTSTGTQIGLNGWFLPAAQIIDDGAFADSTAPTPDDPALLLEVWSGDLGLDLGVPQNVYQLDTSRMTQSVREIDDGAGGTTTAPVRVEVRPGETVDLPDGLGTVTFESLPRFVGLDLRYDPTLGWVLGFALAAIVGLTGSLFLPRRRVFVRLGLDPRGRTVGTAAALARGDDPGLARELQRVTGWARTAPRTAATDTASTAATTAATADEESS